MLCMLYLTELEHCLVRSDLGFALPYTCEGISDVRTLPGIMFADDIVLLAEEEVQLQQLVSLSASHLGHLVLCFNAELALLRFLGSKTSLRGASTKRRTHTIDPTSSLHDYHYIAVTLSAWGACTQQMKSVHDSSHHTCCILHRRCLWVVADMCWTAICGRPCIPWT